MRRGSQVQTSRKTSRFALLGALLFAALQFCAPGGAQAADDSMAPVVVGTHLVTAHDHRRPDTGAAYEWFTPGVYARWSNGATLGVLRNSYKRLGAYGAYTLTSDERAPISAALSLGLISGYAIAPICPLVIPSVAARISDRATLRVLLMPKLAAKQHSSSASVGIEWRL